MVLVQRVVTFPLWVKVLVQRAVENGRAGQKCGGNNGKPKSKRGTEGLSSGDCKALVEPVSFGRGQPAANFVSFILKGGKMYLWIAFRLLQIYSFSPEHNDRHH